MWTGYRVRDLLQRSGVHADADMVLSTSSDGFTAGTPVQALTDDRDALLAIGMNGVALPVEHGYPARLVVLGLYGFVSATKWVIDLELTRLIGPRRTGPGSVGPRAPRSRPSRASTPRDGQRLDPAGSRSAASPGHNPGHPGRRGPHRRRSVASGAIGCGLPDDTWRLWTFDWGGDVRPSHRDRPPPTTPARFDRAIQSPRPGRGDGVAVHLRGGVNRRVVRRQGGPASGRSGTVTVTAVPLPSRRRKPIAPPADSTPTTSDARPMWPSPTRRSRICGSKPTPSSATRSTVSPACGAAPGPPGLPGSAIHVAQQPRAAR